MLTPTESGDGRPQRDIHPHEYRGRLRRRQQRFPHKHGPVKTLNALSGAPRSIPRRRAVSQPTGPGHLLLDDCATPPPHPKDSWSMPKLSLRRHPRGTAEAPPDQPDLPSAPIATASHQSTSTWATKATTGVLTAALLLGPVGAATGLLALRTATQPDTQPTGSAPADLSSQRATAGEYATRLVVAWLQATQTNDQDLRALLDQPPAASSRTPFKVTAPAVAAIIAQPDDIWAVTVAATVTDARERATRRYFQVPVRLHDATLTALTLPSPVAGPAHTTTTDVDYPAIIALTSVLAAGIGQFLDAYLTADGDVTRYLTPGTALPPVTPPAYTDVTLQDLRADTDLDPDSPPADATSLRVLATATAAVTDTQTVTVTYPLTLTARDGRWEVTAIDPAPALDPTDSTAQTTT